MREGVGDQLDRPDVITTTPRLGMLGPPAFRAGEPDRRVVFGVGPKVAMAVLSGMRHNS